MHLVFVLIGVVLDNVYMTLQFIKVCICFAWRPVLSVHGPMAAESVPHRWQPGTRVIAKDLVGAKELNGVPGKVVSYEEVKGRYAVKFSNDSPAKLLKAENLVASPTDAATIEELRWVYSDTLDSTI